MDKERLQNKVFWFNLSGSILVSENPETERGMGATTRTGLWRDCPTAESQVMLLLKSRAARGNAIVTTG